MNRINSSGSTKRKISVTGRKRAVSMQLDSGKTGNVLGSDNYNIIILQSLRRIMRATDLHSRRLASRYHITTPQLVCLLTILEHEPVTVGMLARFAHLSPSTVIGILDRLESKGLIVRNRDKKDRRVVHVSMTGQGKKVAHRAPSPLQDKLAAGLKQLSETDQSAIAEALRKIVELMEAEQIDAAPILETGKLHNVRDANS